MMDISQIDQEMKVTSIPENKSQQLKPADQKTKDIAKSSESLKLPGFPDTFSYGFEKTYRYKLLGGISKDALDKEIVRRIVDIYANFLTENGKHYLLTGLHFRGERWFDNSVIKNNKKLAFPCSQHVESFKQNLRENLLNSLDPKNKNRLAITLEHLGMPIGTLDQVLTNSQITKEEYPDRNFYFPLLTCTRIDADNSSITIKMFELKKD